jgi:hypothetical protein
LEGIIVHLHICSTCRRRHFRNTILLTTFCCCSRFGNISLLNRSLDHFYSWHYINFGINHSDICNGWFDTQWANSYKALAVYYYIVPPWSKLLRYRLTHCIFRIIGCFNSCFRSRKLRLTTIGDLPCWPRKTPLSTKVGTKFCWQVAVAQSVQ